jgi:hypothetical protein
MLNVGEISIYLAKEGRNIAPVVDITVVCRLFKTFVYFAGRSLYTAMESCGERLIT